MPLTLLTRLGGVAAVVGGGVNLVSSQVHFGGPLRAAVPLSVLCLLIAVVGWHAQMWGEEGAWGLCGFVLIAVGLAFGVVGMTGSALGVVGSGAAARAINTGEHAGLVLIGAGMLAWAIPTLRHRALGGWSFVPVVIGLCGLMGATVVDSAAFAAIENGFIPVVFGSSWVLLGIALLTTSAPATNGAS